VVAQTERMSMFPDPVRPICADVVSKPVGPACPQNWYLMAQSTELTHGGILARPLGDIEIVLYRGLDSGGCVAFGAHCAHAGCHLRHGRVVGDSLQCALHHRVIRSDGQFLAKDGSVLASATQFCLPVVERFGCIFVFAGRDTFDFPMPDICALGPVSTRVLPPQTFPLSWSTLVSNGMDIDHLQAVHDRKLREPPDFEQLNAYSVRLSYCARVTGDHISDKVMKWISNDRIRTSITWVGGSMMLVESPVGTRRTFVILSMCPLGGRGSTVRAVAGVTGAPDRISARMSAAVAAWLFHAFLKKDVGILAQMDWHEPDVHVTLGDSLMGGLCRFFRTLPDFAGGATEAMQSKPALPNDTRAASLRVASSRGI